LETVFLVFLGALLFKFSPKWVFYGFIIFTFVLLISHVVDFPLVRLMDMSFWFTINWISQESYQNFVQLLYASNISIQVWIVLALGGLGLIGSSILLYWCSDKLTHRRPLFLTYNGLAIAIFSSVFFLFVWDSSTVGFTQASLHEEYQKALPWKSTFFPPKEEFLALPGPLKAQQIHPQSIGATLVRNPDIFLFVVESLRDDFLTEGVAPHCAAFKQQNISFPLAFSNANATHLSWFSLFHSELPFHWGKEYRNPHPQGSVALQMLKELGYQIHVYSSAHLAFYRQGEVLFGEKMRLADSVIETFLPDQPIHEGDSKAVHKLIADLSESKELGGRLFVVFLDATHFDYSWPKEQTYFLPCEEKINYMLAASSRSNLEKIKNRYRNAIHFIDSLFGEFLQALDSHPKGKESVVIFSADHGEAFYEDGHIFHASSLSRPQMHIPLYYRLGQDTAMLKEKICSLTSQVDVFPTLLHYLTGKEWSGFKGESIFKEGRWPFAVVGRNNASRAPYEFCIHDGYYKMIARFSNTTDIFSSASLKIMSVKNLKDENIPHDTALIERHFGQAIETLFPR
jgi:hypothetical protein